jgi:cholesterol oxidase-like protein
MTALVWSERRRRYAPRTADRDDARVREPARAPGRALVANVTLRAASARHLRWVSHTDIPANELFAPPASAGQTLASFLETSGRVQAIWYPFTDVPWLKVWTVSPRGPTSSGGWSERRTTTRSRTRSPALSSARSPGGS